MKKEKNIQDKIIDDWSLSDEDLLDIVDDELDEYYNDFYKEKRTHAILRDYDGEKND